MINKETGEITSQKAGYSTQLKETLPRLVEEYAPTVSSALLLLTVKVLASKFLSERSRYKFGGASTDGKAPNILLAVVAAPLIEEFIFRYLPNKTIDKQDKRIRWDVGIPVALLFALGHNLRVKEHIGREAATTCEKNENQTGLIGAIKSLDRKQEVGFSSEHIPLPQFVGGLFNWYLERTKGHKHAVVAHMANNLAAYAFRGMEKKSSK